MKKNIKRVIAFLLCLTVVGPVITTRAEFTPSVSSKPAPEIVTTPDGEGREIIGYVKNSSGNVLSTEYKGALIVTPISEADTSSQIPKKAAEELKIVYNDIVLGKTVFSKYDALNRMVESALGAGKNADALVVRDLFDITEVSSTIKSNLPGQGNTMDITFDLDIAADEFIAVMVYRDSKWQLIPNVVNNGDGTITCTFDYFCPVAFLVPGSGVKGQLVPVTGDTVMKDVTLWVVLAGVSLVVMIGVVLVYRRKRR